MAPNNRSDEEDERDSDQYREEKAARIEVRRMLIQALEKVTRKVETMELAVAIIQAEWDEFKKSRDEFSRRFSNLTESYAELNGHMKLQGRIFGWIAALLLAIIAGLIVALFKKP